jgi:flagellum-specific peptidoglycan hydrolase FlgJ
MITPAQTEFLIDCHAAAVPAKHIWPEYAACEAVLESSWGTSELAVKARNIFGRKMWSPGPDALALPTKEFFHGAWVTVNAYWKMFATMEASFEDRMEILTTDHRYAAVLTAKDGPSYLEQVSKVWSTDPNRASDVLEVWTAHHGVLARGILG